MAPNKFEELVKEKLAAREIEPSADLWNKLEAHLEQSPPPKRKGVPVYWWAAAAVVVVAIGLYWKRPHVGQNTEVPQVVEAAKEWKKEETPQLFPKVALEESKDRVGRGLNTDDTKPIRKSEPILVEHAAEEALVDIPELQYLVQTSPKETIDPIERKLEEIVAVVQTKIEVGEQLTEVEIENLLLEASRELRKEQYLKEDTVVVDADALLAEVELDMQGEKLLKDHIYDALKKGYLKAKTALVSREN